MFGGGVMSAASISGAASPAAVDGGCRAGSSLLYFPSSGLLSPSVFSPRSLSRSRRRNGLRCSSSSTRAPDSGSGDDDGKTVLDAFFLGKAVAESLNERIESTVGEFLSVVGRWQAEQQKQVQDFQKEVIERAKKAKEKAAMQTMMEEQGIIPKSFTTPSNGSISAVSVSSPPSSPSPITEDSVL